MKKIPSLLPLQNDMDYVILLRFLYLACFVVSIYVIFIWVYWILMAYTSSASYLLTKLQPKLSSCEPKEEWPHAGLYNYNGRQIELFHVNVLIVDRLKGHRLMSWWNAWGCCKFNNNLRTKNKQGFIINRMFWMFLINREFE